jgi:hypothetical protein
VFALIGTILLVILIALGAIGYVQNIVKLCGCDFASPYKAEVIRIVGLFPVVGAIVGWLDLGK